MGASDADFAYYLNRLLAVPYYLESLHGHKSSFPFNLRLSWSYTFKGITIISTLVSYFPHTRMPSISILENICVGDIALDLVKVSSSNYLLWEWLKLSTEFAISTMSKTCLGTVCELLYCVVFTAFDGRDEVLFLISLTIGWLFLLFLHCLGSCDQHIYS